MNKSMKNLLAVSLLFVMFSSALVAQNMHIIGDETIETNYPPNTQVFEYGWASMMYTSDEMGEAKSISKIAFDQTTDYAGYWEYAVLPDQKVYMKQVDASNFNSLAYEDPENAANGYTLVFEGTIQFNLSWTDIVLNSNFAYDGTSALIVHYENHRGTSAPITNVKFNASTVITNVFKALGGDGSFPTSFGTYVTERPNIAVFYEGGGPANPTNPTPANNSYKGLLHTDLEFVIGNNTSSFDVYFGTESTPNTLLISDVSVSSPGAYSVNPSDLLGELLDAHTRYYWQVVAKDGSQSSASQIWTFLSQGIIEDFPYFTSFEDEPINPLYADTIDWSWPIAGASNWAMADYDTHTGDFAVNCNIWGEYINSYSLVTPRIHLADNQRANFWWMQNNGDGSEISVYFEISTDGGDNWTVLNQFVIEAPMTDYEQLIVELAGYSGDNVYMRWRYETLNNWVADYFFIDDFGIESAPEGAMIQLEEPNIDFPALAVGGETYLPLEITNIGTVDLVISGSTISAPYSFVSPDPIAPGASSIVNILMTASSEGTFNDSFEFTGDFEGDAEVNLNGSVYQVVYNFFENADLSEELPENWSVIRTLDPYDIFTDVTVESSNYDAFSAPNAFRMMKMNDTISPLMFITEGVGGYANNKLSFYAKKSYDDYDAILEVGLTADPLHHEGFTEVETFVMTTEYQLFEVEFPANTTEPYISFSFIGGRYASAIWIDDIEWDAMGDYPPYCPFVTSPQADAVDVDVMMGLELNWTSGGGGPTGYKLSVGTNPEADNILNAEDVGMVLNYSFPTNPEWGLEYFWKVIAYNAHGESDGCSISSFTIMDDPVVGIPFFEDFDGIDALGNREYPLGWSIDNANNDNFPWDVISDAVVPGMAHSTPNAMHMLFSLNEMDDYLFTPPVALNAGVVYELSFWYRTMGDQWVPEPVERMKVLIGDDNVGTAMTTELYKNTTIDNQDWIQEKVSFSVEDNGQYFIGFHGYSEPNQGLLLLDDVGIDFITQITKLEEKQVSIYPNPATEKIQINSMEGIQNIKVYNMSGSLLWEETHHQNNIEMETSSLSRGAYMIVIETEKNILREKLIIR